MRRRAMALILLVLAGTLTACSIPHEKGGFSIEKVAADKKDTEGAFRRYRSVRDLAVRLSDPKPLSTVESGPLLAIDTGIFTVSKALDRPQSKDGSTLNVFDVASPTLSRYPLWFTAKVRDRSRGVIRVQVFERATAVDPWLLVSSPETLLDTMLPPLERGPHGTFLPVAPNENRMPVGSPQEVADAYAKALAKPGSAQARRFENDGFIKQMRTTTEANKRLKNVTFTQSWTPQNVTFAARTTDGGMLVWATLSRTDSYRVSHGIAVAFPEGSIQKAFLGRDITSSGKLHYYHQVLLYAPGPNGGKPRALGQYGSVVGAEGF